MAQSDLVSIPWCLLASSWSSVPEWAATSTPSVVKGAYTHGDAGYQSRDWITTAMERRSGTAIKLAVDGDLSSCALMFVDRYRYLSTNNVPAVLSH